jgi:hypothetical protein
MQRGGRAWSRRKAPRAAASREVQHAQVPERCERRSRDESNARSEPAAAGGAEAGVFQRNRAAENGRLAVRCTLDSEIPGKTVPTTAEQEGTRHTSRGQSSYCKPWRLGEWPDIHNDIHNNELSNGTELSAPCLFWGGDLNHIGHGASLFRDGSGGRRRRADRACPDRREGPPYTKVRRFC